MCPLGGPASRRETDCRTFLSRHLAPVPDFCRIQTGSELGRSGDALGMLCGRSGEWILALCPVPCALYSVPCALCPVPCALCPVPCALCRALTALCPVPCALQVPCALCPVLCALCPVPSALYPASCALCPVPCALCPVLCALCPVLCALCLGPTARPGAGEMKSIAEWNDGRAIGWNDGRCMDLWMDGWVEGWRDAVAIWAEAHQNHI